MSQIPTHVTDIYRVQVAYLSGHEPFASEAYTVLLPQGHDVAAAAHALAASSPYWKSRIPDLSRTVLFSPPSANEPGPPVGSARICEHIWRYLVISTQHLRCATGDLLNRWAALPAIESPLAVATSSWGWCVPTCDLPDSAGSAMPPEIRPILAFARSTGCSYILFDHEAVPIADLPSFPW